MDVLGLELDELRQRLGHGLVAALRLVVRGPRVGKVNIQWSMICANSSSDVAQTRNFSFNAQMPRLVDLSNRLGGVKNWKVCFVEARVQYNRRGAVTLLMQARY